MERDTGQVEIGKNYAQGELGSHQIVKVGIVYGLGLFLAFSGWLIFVIFKLSAHC